MKSKNKFTNNFNLISRIKNSGNNFKNYKYINVIIVTLIVGFSIYLLYFNDKIHVQDAIANSLNENTNCNNNNENDTDLLVENFDVAKYVDICKNRKTNFYNLNAVPTSATNIDDCEKMCNTNNCHVFTLQNGMCKTYKGQLDESNIDTRNTPNRNPIKINCDTKILPDNKYDAGVYSGSGFMNKVYYQNNKNDLQYLDPYLEESVDILGDLYSLEAKRNQLRGLDPQSSTYDISYHNLSLSTINKDKALFRKFDTLNKDIFDSSRNVFYTDMYNSSDIRNTILAPAERDNAFLEDVDKKYNMVKKSDNLDGILDAVSNNFVTNNIRYLVLAFIMVITIIVLILYKSSNFINEKVLIVYIIGISFMVLFITHQLKFF
jgi:hypothetical protein